MVSNKAVAMRCGGFAGQLIQGMEGVQGDWRCLDWGKLVG